MLVPAYVDYFPPKFSAIGGSPAVNLCRDIYAFSHRPTKVLSLACGDFRHILFTLWSESGHKTRHSYEFTTCDLEPAVLARNIFLCSYIASTYGTNGEQGTTDKDLLWNMYYHLDLTQDAVTKLRDHASCLSKAAQSLETWAKSSYGKFLKFSSAQTLKDIQKYLQLYTTEVSYGTYRRQQTRSQTRSIIQATNDGRRTAGIHGLSDTFAISGGFRKYWETGVVAGNHHDATELARENGGHRNPLFALLSASGSTRFNVQYGTDPLFSFHLAAGFDKVATDDERLEALVDLAKSQFQAWCACLAGHIEADSIQLVFHCGDALNFSYELQGRILGNPVMPKFTHMYTAQWSARPLTLDCEDFDLTRKYDVIDTSNLSDHLGILNLLPAVAPLLDSNVQAILYTQILASEDTHTNMVDILQTEVANVVLVTGLAPVGYLLGSTTDHYGVETMIHETLKLEDGWQHQFRSRVSWRRPGSGDRNTPTAELTSPYIHVEPVQFAEFFLKWYLAIFEPGEDLKDRLVNGTLDLKCTMNASPRPLSPKRQRYSRLTVAALLSLAKRTLSTDWNKFMKWFIENLHSERTLEILHSAGASSFHELRTILHLVGIWQDPVCSVNPVLPARTAYPGLKDVDIQQFPSDMPKVVHIALVTPRKDLEMFTESGPKFITPNLRITVTNEGKPLRTAFDTSSGVDFFFGKLIPAPSLDHSTLKQGCTVVEDALGWEGNSDLIATCTLPTWRLLTADREFIRVAVGVNASATRTDMDCIRVIPMLYRAGFDDTKNLFVFRSPPVLAGGSDAPPLRPALQQSLPSSSHHTLAIFKDANLSTFTIRTQFKGEAEVAELLAGGQVTVRQDSPCTMTLSLNGKLKTLAYRLPVKGSGARMRISRKQSWVEVISPITSASQEDGFSCNPSPVVSVAGQTVSWGLSRVDLSLQPRVQVLEQMAGCLPQFLKFTTNRVGDQVAGPSRSLCQLKDSLAFMMQMYGDFILNSEGNNIDCFKITVNGSTNTLIIIKALRHEQDSGSVVLDAFVVPLTSGTFPHFVSDWSVALKDRTLSKNISEEEEMLWQQMMPALVERCRFTWEHAPDCAYRQGEFTCPLSISHNESPICTCGCGQNSEDIPPGLEGLAPFATRIALSPLSSVPFMDKSNFMPPTPPTVHVPRLGPKISRNDIVLPPDAPDDPADTTEQKPFVFSFTRTSDDTASSENADRPSPRLKTETPVGGSGKELARCSNCGTKVKALKPCVRCGVANYCSRTCSQSHWKKHKKDCKDAMKQKT